ncbi:AAA family ATPase [Shewanella surugensis]|uniref:AAA family ATPase n=1 Tax=Shewanella surugensis TaxID=212020 RepID=A0ABT0LJ81_9GAMM|nr:AAA family ATPase [Shewanella surugensis]MCL1127772.1 AAA family ATPase [Shewanella surugensis]
MYQAQNSLRRIAERSHDLLTSLTEEIEAQKREFNTDSYFQTYSKAAVAKLPHLSKAVVDKAVGEMEDAGYQFGKRKAGNTEKYAMTISDIVSIYEHRKVKKYRDKRNKAFTIFVANLKGGVSKTVTTVSLAHGLRTHPTLLKEDIRVLVIDLDPQSSATMFLNHRHSIGVVDTTAAQAILQNVSREELINEFIVKSGVDGVDVIPASIDDAFIASNWEALVTEHLPGENPNNLLSSAIIDKLDKDYDFIFIDSGPHLDAFLKNALTCSDLLMTPIPPAQVDFHSTLKYLNRLPELMSVIEESGANPKLKGNIGFMTKLANKVDHKLCHSLAKEIFGGDMLDAVLPRLDAFERCGESFDTVITANPNTYVGSKDALKGARVATEDFSKAVYDRIEFIRSNGGA